MMQRPRTWENPFGDGNAALRILATCTQNGTL